MPARRARRIHALVIALSRTRNNNLEGWQDIAQFCVWRGCVRADTAC